MCLHAFTGPHKGPITVYKVVKEIDGELYSPFMGCPLPSTSPIRINRFGKIDRAIHAFVHEKDALRLADILPYLRAGRFKVITGTVVEYYLGLDDSGKPAIATEKIEYQCD